MPDASDPMRSIRMDAKETANPVDRAIADIRRATNRLIKLLASKDESVGLRAAAALAMVDPPPIWALTDVLIQSGDKGSLLGTEKIVR